MPLAAAGLTVTPAGRVTSVFSGSVSVTPPGVSSPSFGSLSSKSRPEAESDWPVVGTALTLGLNGTASHPVRETGLPPASRITPEPSIYVPGFAVESTFTFMPNGPEQSAGRVRYGSSGASDGKPPELESGPRSGV